jgi:hypothetical protein
MTEPRRSKRKFCISKYDINDINYINEDRAKKIKKENIDKTEKKEDKTELNKKVDKTELNKKVDKTDNKTEAKTEIKTDNKTDNKTEIKTEAKTEKNKVDNTEKNKVDNTEKNKVDNTEINKVDNTEKTAKTDINKVKIDNNIINEKLNKEKNKNNKNKYCTLCDILLDIKFFEVNNKLYCNICYNKKIKNNTINIENKIDPKTPSNNGTDISNTLHHKKINFIIMKKDNPNLIKIINNKILQTNIENINKQVEKDNKEKEKEKDNKEKPKYNKIFYNYDKDDLKTPAGKDDEDDEDDYEDYEDYEDDEDDYEEKGKGKGKESEKGKEKNKEIKKNINNYEKEFDTLFFTSLLNRINNSDKECCPFENKTTNKPTNKTTNKKNKDNKNDDINDNDNSSLEYEWLGKDIKDIDDLIRIGKTYNPKKIKRHNLNLKKLNKLVDPLIELKNMIGMKEVKKIIFDQIIYYLQNLDDKNVDMLHTVIVGPPGVGKTQLTHIIAKIYNKLGFLKTDKVICAKRDDLVGEYVGQTAPKTRKVLESALGGVLLLDEVYALSPNSEKDFAREAIDMINVYLSEHCHDLVCVIAGYKKPTYEHFLAHNEGLARRFTHHFEIKGYNSEELTLIYKKYLEEQKWGLLPTVEQMIPLIEKNLKLFPNFGGDMTTLFACCKKTHSKRLLLIPTEEELNNTKKNIHIDDIEKGIKLFIDIKTKSKSDEDSEDKEKFSHMYC